MLSFRSRLNTSVMLMPWIATFAIFWLYPLIYAAYLSLTDYNTLTGLADFKGFGNYTAIFSDDVFWKALSNTMIFTFGTVPVTTSLALLLAVFLNSKMTRFKEFFRASYFMPTVTSLVVISLIFTNLYSKDGYVNALLSILNLPYAERGWLLEPGTALFSIMAMDVWMATGYYMVLFLAGMQSIPNDLYESARLSGASISRMFFSITLPLLKPTLLFILVINTIKSFQIFVEIFVMTKGGPLNATTTLVYQIFVNAFERSDKMGYASALAFVLFFILIIFSLLQMRFLREKD
ncbi:MAG: sugar ABC transporter permease [Candidatus Kapabacteria bacterium]|nr:sugar ABC transporter permease [Ignavibacteriota bacterium]MCW5884343.1 sugar ABC transporter permease [Candidatus Kapabacteria bacterium]